MNIQTASLTQRHVTQTIKSRLIDKGFRVLGIEDLGEAKLASEQVEIGYCEDVTKRKAN